MRIIGLFLFLYLSFLSNEAMARLCGKDESQIDVPFINKNQVLEAIDAKVKDSLKDNPDLALVLDSFRSEIADAILAKTMHFSQLSGKNVIKSRNTVTGEVSYLILGSPSMLKYGKSYVATLQQTGLGERSKGKSLASATAIPEYETFETNDGRFFQIRKVLGRGTMGQIDLLPTPIEKINQIDLIVRFKDAARSPFKSRKDKIRNSLSRLKSEDGGVGDFIDGNIEVVIDAVLNRQVTLGQLSAGQLKKVVNLSNQKTHFILADSAQNFFGPAAGLIFSKSENGNWKYDKRYDSLTTGSTLAMPSTGRTFKVVNEYIRFSTHRVKQIVEITN